MLRKPLAQVVEGRFMGSRNREYSNTVFHLDGSFSVCLLLPYLSNRRIGRSVEFSLFSYSSTSIAGQNGLATTLQ
jgi:hypothetical protein